MALAVFSEVFLCLRSWKADEPHCLGVSRQRSSLKSDFQYGPRNRHRVLKTLGGIKRNQEITEEHPVAPFWAPLTSYSRDPPSLHISVCFPLHIGNIYRSSPVGDLYLKTSWMDWQEGKGHQGLMGKGGHVSMPLISTGISQELGKHLPAG